MRASSTLLVIAADAREFTGLRRRLGEGDSLRWPIDFSRAVSRGNERWVLVANGPGPKLAGEAFDVSNARDKAGAVLNTGYCGALDPALKLAEVVRVKTVLDTASGRAHATRHGQGITLACGDRVVGTVAEKAQLRERTGADAVDMESAAVASRAEEAGLPFFCVRVVSDTASEGFDADLNAARDPTGRFSARAIVGQALRKPWTRVPELIRLGRHSRLASEKLGDFLAGCRF